MYGQRGIDDGSMDREEEAELRANISRLKKLCDSGKPEERQERDALLIYLRKKGYTRSEVRDIIGERLKEDTIRKIISGVEADESAVRERTAQLLVDMIKADLGFDDIRAALKIRNELPDAVTVKELASLLADIQQNPDAVGGVKGVLSMYSEMKAQQGLTFAQVKEFLAYQREISLTGIQAMHLQKISEVAKKYRKGDINQLMDALSSFDSLESLKEKVKKEEDLMEAAARKRDIAEKDAAVAMAKYAHIREAIAICKEMITKYGFTTAAFNDISELAKKCGSPTEVLNVLAHYVSLTGQIKTLSDQRNALDSEVKSLQENASKSKAELEGLRQSIAGLLKPVSNEITNAYTDAINNITTIYQEQLRALKGASEEYGERLGKSLALKDELEFAKVINLIIKYPLEARELPLDYAIILLDAVKKMLVAKRIEVKIKAQEAGMDKSVPFVGMEFEVKDLVEGARRALEIIVVRS
jgi:outer membrane murein-binding lipoprotein Lpp